MANGTPIPIGEHEAACGARFRKLRREAGLTQEALAGRLGISINTLRWHEAGARPFRGNTLILAAHHMNTEVMNLMQPEEEDGKAKPRRRRKGG